MNGNKQVGIGQLFRESKSAHESKNWGASEDINTRLMRLLVTKDETSAEDLLTVARRYLSSIVGLGTYLNRTDFDSRANFDKKITEFRSFLSSQKNLTSTLDYINKEITELQLYIAMPRADTLSKSARALRRIGRPDLAVELCNFQLRKTRLNYYSLIARSWALGDLGHYDNAIRDAEIALKYDPNRKKNYSQVALSRAYRLRFTKNGDIDDGELALNYAEQALLINRNFAAAEAFICIAGKMKLQNQLIEKLIREFPKLIHHIDSAAVESAWRIELRFESESDLNSQLDDIEDFTEDDSESCDDAEDLPDDYYEDYLPEQAESLSNPRSPHLEP
jgi:tetratricopeptide (TPR) repeat protein